MNATRKLLPALLPILVAATALSACGRKGPLDRPGVAATPEAASASDSGGIAGGFSDFDGGGDLEDVPPQVPQRRFILDPLID